MLKTLVILIQVIFAGLLITAILLQSRGTGLGSIWGGSGETYRSKRGAERILFMATIAFAALFLLASIANTLIK